MFIFLYFKNSGKSKKTKKRHCLSVLDTFFSSKKGMCPSRLKIRRIELSSFRKVLKDEMTECREKSFLKKKKKKITV
ncbi:hypothetical protein B5F77_04275 [Parabacteroides sp. An277]|nr:hypothetical protein B5F77_04275 [Parabacteroides sp. An277]